MIPGASARPSRPRRKARNALNYVLNARITMDAGSKIVATASARLRAPLH